MFNSHIWTLLLNALPYHSTFFFMCLCVLAACVRPLIWVCIYFNLESVVYLNDVLLAFFSLPSTFLVGFTLFPLFGWSFTQCSRLEETNKESRQLILKDRLIHWCYVWFRASHRFFLAFFRLPFLLLFFSAYVCFVSQRNMQSIMFKWVVENIYMQSIASWDERTRPKKNTMFERN